MLDQMLSCDNKIVISNPPWAFTAKTEMYVPALTWAELCERVYKKAEL